MGLTDFTRKHGSEQKAKRTEAIIAEKRSHTLLCDPHNQAAGRGLLGEKRRALKRNAPKGPCLFLYHIKKLLEASEVVNSGTGQL